MSHFTQLVRAFRYRNYRLFFAGQLVSLIGTWITSIATSWLAFRLTKSEFVLGLVGFAGQFPAFLLAPFAGVLVDSWNRRKVLIATQFTSMLQSLVLAYLTLSGEITVASLCVLCVIQALINAFDMPARQSFVNEMIEDRADMSNAIALNSAMFHGARLIGPAIGGIIIATSSEGMCFLIDGISYLAVLVSLFFIRIPDGRALYSRHSLLEGLADGARYAFGFRAIRELLLLVALMSLFGIPHIVLMPVFAQDVLHGGPSLLGFLMGASGCGAVVGALYLASRKSIRGLIQIIIGAGALLGSSLLAFAWSGALWLSVPLLFLMGISMITLLASCNTIIQTLVEPMKRGRVMSFYMMAFMGMMPIGSLLSGALASRVGAPLTVSIGGFGCLFIITSFSKKRGELQAAVEAALQR